MVGWGLFGFTLLIIAYLLFEFLTPTFNVDKEIENDNRSIGFISLVISVGLIICYWCKYFLGAVEMEKLSKILLAVGLLFVLVGIIYVVTN